MGALPPFVFVTICHLVAWQQSNAISATISVDGSGQVKSRESTHEVLDANGTEKKGKLVRSAKRSTVSVDGASRMRSRESSHEVIDASGTENKGKLVRSAKRSTINVDASSRKRSRESSHEVIDASSTENEGKLMRSAQSFTINVDGSSQAMLPESIPEVLDVRDAKKKNSLMRSAKNDLLLPAESNSFWLAASPMRITHQFPIVGFNSSLLQQSNDIAQILLGAKIGPQDCMEVKGTTGQPVTDADGSEIIMQEVQAVLVATGAIVLLSSAGGGLEPGTICCPSNGNEPAPFETIDYTGCVRPENQAALIESAPIGGYKKLIVAELLNDANLEAAADQLAHVARISEPDTLLLVDDRVHAQVLQKLAHTAARHRVSRVKFFGEVFSAVSSAVSTVKNVVSDVGNAVHQVAGQVADTATGVVGAVGNAVNGVVGAVGNAVNGVAGAVGGMVGTGLTRVTEPNTPRAVCDYQKNQIFALQGHLEGARSFGMTKSEEECKNKCSLDPLCEVWTWHGDSHNLGENCWNDCGEKAGFCNWCGEGHACCRSDDEGDCELAIDAADSFHSCVKLGNRLDEDCWNPCGQKGGFCDFCGKGLACCRAGFDGDPSECKEITKGGGDNAHLCVEVRQGSTPKTPEPGACDWWTGSEAEYHDRLLPSTWPKENGHVSGRCRWLEDLDLEKNYGKNDDGGAGWKDHGVVSKEECKEFLGMDAGKNGDKILYAVMGKSGTCNSYTTWNPESTWTLEETIKDVPAQGAWHFVGFAR